MKSRLLAALVLLTSGRAMTLAFIHRAGDGGPGDPPDAWLMPLLGDAAVGLTALVLAWLIFRRPSPSVWLASVVWNGIAIFDAGAAYVVETSAPWPEFFMLELFGRSMFALAIGMHFVIAWLQFQPDVRRDFSVTIPAEAVSRTAA